MTKDSTDFVRQGALVSLAMILVQHSEAQTPKAKMARELFEKTVSDKHEDSLAKFGAAISQGIIDAGGRNVTISMQTKAGTPNMMAIVGMTLFSQFWYWFPLAHCLSLSFNPTGVIGLDESLKVGVTARGGSDPIIRKLTKCTRDALMRLDTQAGLCLQRTTFLVCLPGALRTAEEGDSGESQDCCPFDYGSGQRPSKSSRAGKGCC